MLWAGVLNLARQQELSEIRSFCNKQSAKLATNYLLGGSENFVFYEDTETHRLVGAFAGRLLDILADHTKAVRTAGAD